MAKATAFGGCKPTRPTRVSPASIRVEEEKDNPEIEGNKSIVA